MSDLMHYPSEDLEANKQAHIKGAPYVKFKKVFQHHVFEAEGGSYSEPREETHYFPLGTAPNVEALANMQANGCKFVGYGNLPKKAPYGEISTWLRRSTGMVMEDENSPEYKALEAKILAKAAAAVVEPVAEIAEAKPAKKAKAEPVAVSEGVTPPEGL